MIRFACPNCEKVYTVPESSGGKAATCKKCGSRFQIPDAPASYEMVEEAQPATPVPVLPPPPPPLPPPPVPAQVQHAETMMMPVLPPANASAGGDQSSETMMMPALPPLPPREPDVAAIPDLLTAPPPVLPPPPSLSFAPPPPPPPPEGTVDLQPCPTCGARLTVNAADVGAQVECSTCKTVFEGKAATAGTPADAPASTDVDIAPCPKCKSELTVSESDLGNDVECPHCQTVYKAERPQARSGTVLAKSVRRPAAPPPAPPGDTDKRKPYEFKPKKEKKKDSPFQEDDEDDDRPSKRKKSRRRDDDDDDDDDDDRPRRRRRSSSYSYGGGYTAHRGQMLLILAVVGIIFMRILCIVVWVLANNDLKEMDAGRMDPEGRSQTNTAKIIGMIGTIFLCLALVLVCVWFVFVFAIIGAAGSGALK